MIKIQWLPDALEDLKRLHSFIEPHSPVAAARAVEAILEAIESLVKFPEKGRPWDTDLEFRELSTKFGSRGYVIRYKYINEEVFIVRVWHSLEEH